MLARLPNNRKSHSLLLGMQNGTTTLEDSLAVSYKVNIVLPSSPAFTLLCIYWIDLKLCLHKTLHMNIINSSFSHNCQNWKQSRCPSIGQQTNKPAYIHPMEYYSLKKLKELSSHKKTWQNLNCTLLTERN